MKAENERGISIDIGGLLQALKWLHRRCSSEMKREYYLVIFRREISVKMSGAGE